VRYGTTGWPVPGYEVELRGDDGQPVPDGEIGDLYIHGPSAAMMYWGNRTKTRETFQGGWTKSGDKYMRNADGSYTYGGRSDDMLKVSGIYVSPFEVEATLVQHAAVLEAAVIGVPDAEGLTKTKAFVVLKAGARGHGRRAEGLREGQAGALQIPAPDRVRGRTAQDCHRQDPALQAARPGSCLKPAEPVDPGLSTSRLAGQPTCASNTPGWATADRSARR
jgi:acyl-coenzyme A synthetase/AMP-(fatty) acid ligase